MSSDIIISFRKQNIDEIKKYIDDGNDIKSLSKIRELTEQQAYFGGKGFDIIKLLIEYAKLDVSSYSLLKNACFSTSYDLVKYLIDNNIDTVSIPLIGDNVFAATVSTVERENNKIKILKLLLENNAKPEQFIDSAVILNKEATKILIKQGVSLNRIMSNMPLLEFIGRRKLKHPLSYSLLPDNSNEIHVAICENNMTRFLELLDDKTLNLNIETMKPPIYTSIEYDRLDMLKLFIDKKASINPVSSVFGKPTKNENLLHIACKENNLKIVEYLLSLKGKFDINMVNDTYWGEETCLNIAISNNNTEMVKLLLENNADPNTILRGYTVGITVGALSINGVFNKDILVLLIKHGLNLELHTKFGRVIDYLTGRAGINLELLKV